MRLESRHVAVTGAGSGIGRALARAAAANGAAVTCIDIDEAAVAGVAAELRDAGWEAAAVTCDITDRSSVERACQAAVEAFGRVHGLLANAGGAQGRGVAFLEMSVEAWDEMIARNLHGAFHTGQVFARRMVEDGGGSIVFTSSQLSMRAVAGLAHYATAKGGVTQLVRAMALELAPHGVRVNAIAPGATLTEGNRQHLETPESRRYYAERIPLGRVASPEEITGGAIHLLSDEASYTTGTTLVIDGGFTIV